MPLNLSCCCLACRPRGHAADSVRLLDAAACCFTCTAGAQYAVPVCRVLRPRLPERKGGAFAMHHLGPATSWPALLPRLQPPALGLAVLPAAKKQNTKRGVFALLPSSLCPLSQLPCCPARLALQQELMRLNVFKGAASLVNAEDFIGRCKVSLDELSEVRGPVQFSLARLRTTKRGAAGACLVGLEQQLLHSSRCFCCHQIKMSRHPFCPKRLLALPPCLCPPPCLCASDARRASRPVGAPGQGRVLQRGRMCEWRCMPALYSNSSASMACTRQLAMWCCTTSTVNSRYVVSTSPARLSCRCC